MYNAGEQILFAITSGTKNSLVNKKNSKILATYLYLIFLDLRQAYLIDCCSNQDWSLNLFQNINSELRKFDASISFPSTIIMRIGDSDFAFVRTDYFKRKCELLRHGVFPIICEIGNEPVVSQVNFVDQLYDILKFRASLPIEDYHILTISLEGLEIGYPLFAGWLLSYPVTYHHFLEAGSMSFKNGLSFQQLLKVAFHANIRFSPNSQIYADIMQFSSPLCILDDAGISERFDASIQDIHDKLNTLSYKFLYEYNIVVEISLKKETVCLANPIL